MIESLSPLAEFFSYDNVHVVLYYACMGSCPRLSINCGGGKESLVLIRRLLQYTIAQNYGAIGASD